MGINKLELINIIEEIAPPFLQENWDNCGMQVNAKHEDINKILVTLEITRNVLDEAIENKVDFIITHHPLIFGAIKKIDYNDIIGNYIFKLIENGISVYSAHTSFDTVKGGNNDYLAEILELENIRGFGEICSEDVKSIGRVGDLSSEISLLELFDKLAVALKIEKVKMSTVGDWNKKIRTVGICTGAGAEFTSEANKSGFQVLITGDVKYHQAQIAKENGVCIIDAGHFGTEKIFVENFAKKLKENFKGDILESKLNLDPFN